MPSLSKTTRTGSETPTQSFSRPGGDDNDDDGGDDYDDDDDHDDDACHDILFKNTFPKELIIGSDHKSLPDCSACTPHLCIIICNNDDDDDDVYDGI